jgi:hypothetical protein
MVKHLPMIPDQNGTCAGCGRPARTADGDGCARPRPSHSTRPDVRSSRRAPWAQASDAGGAASAGRAPMASARVSGRRR